MEMKLPDLSRRKFFTSFGARAGRILGVGMVLVKCAPAKKEEKRTASDASADDPCSDYADVPDKDQELRRKFAYVSNSPIPDNQCSNCNLYLPPANGSPCGGCMLFKGPVHASGYCTYWAPKIEEV